MRRIFGEKRGKWGGQGCSGLPALLDSGLGCAAAWVAIRNGTYQGLLKKSLTLRRQSTKRNAALMATPEGLRIASLVSMKLVMSPQPLTANRATANHQAQFLRRSRPTAAQAVPVARSNKNATAQPSSRRNSTMPGSFSFESRSRSTPLESKVTPTKIVVAAAAKRKLETKMAAIGLDCIAWIDLYYCGSRSGAAETQIQVD